MTNTMSEKQTYNGWTNYETWNVKLWLDNDQGTQEYWIEQSKLAIDMSKADDLFTREENATLKLAECLKNELDIDMHDSQGVPKLDGFYADLLNAALSEVNWHEIAKSFIEDLE